MAKKLARRLKMKKHKIVDIGFMKNLYGDNVLTDSKRNVPNKFEYSIVVPIRNDRLPPHYTLGAQLVYGAHYIIQTAGQCLPKNLQIRSI